MVVSGDAVVAKDGKIFEKPRNVAEAMDFLRQLSGSAFQFVTSLGVLRGDIRKIRSIVEMSEIRFRPLIEREIRITSAGTRWLRYAGAFDGDGVLRFGESICGSCNIFTAMPVSKLAVFLREMGVDV